MRVSRRTAALFFKYARLVRQPSPIDVALKVGWLLVFGVGLQQPTFVGSQQKKTDDQQTDAIPSAKFATSIGGGRSVGHQPSVRPIVWPFYGKSTST